MSLTCCGPEASVVTSRSKLSPSWDRNCHFPYWDEPGRKGAATLETASAEGGRRLEIDCAIPRLNTSENERSSSDVTSSEPVPARLRDGGEAAGVADEAQRILLQLCSDGPCSMIFCNHLGSPNFGMRCREWRTPRSAGCISFLPAGGCCGRPVIAALDEPHNQRRRMAHYRRAERKKSRRFDERK